MTAHRCPKHHPGACCKYDELLREIFKDKAAVEQALFDAANGKSPMPDQQRLRELALLLGHAGPLLSAHLAAATPPAAVAAEDARAGLVDCGECRTQGCPVGKCRNAATTHPAPAVAAEAGQGERERFEAWAKEYGRIFINRKGDGYEFNFTQEAWVAWQARATQPAQPLSETKPKSLSAAVADSLRPYMSAGQKVIWREAFRWKDDNGVMSNHYECMSVRALAEDFRYEVIEDCGCAAIIQPAGNGKAGT